MAIRLTYARRRTLLPVIAWLCDGTERWNDAVRGWVQKGAPQLLLEYGDRTRYWKTARLDAEFKVLAEWVLWCYGNAQNPAARGLWVVFVDEIPNLQLLERRPIRRARPGWIKKQEFECTRHGTVNFGNSAGLLFRGVERCGRSLRPIRTFPSNPLHALFPPHNLCMADGAIIRNQRVRTHYVAPAEVITGRARASAAISKRGFTPDQAFFLPPRR